MPPAVELHRKEFGDVAWYTTNILNWYDLSLAGAIGVADNCGLADLDAAALEHAANDPAIFKKPGVHFLTSTEMFIDATERVLEYGDMRTTRTMFRAAGQLMVAQSILLQLRLDAGLATVLPDNVSKIERRIRQGNVYDPAGGDAR